MESITSWDSLVRLEDPFDGSVGCPMFQLVGPLDQLWRASCSKGPLPDRSPEKYVLFYFGFLICHGALLSAPTVVGSGRPEDAQLFCRAHVSTRESSTSDIGWAARHDERRFALLLAS